MGILEEIKADFKVIFERDPAARNKLEVIFTEDSLSYFKVSYRD